jgi:translocator protein
MKALLSTIVFIILNFLALAIGGFYTGDGVSSSWYQELNKAPWTPPGWLFGVAWTLIMICFAIYMAQLYIRIKKRTLLLVLFFIQWILNVAWNPVFFYFRDVEVALVLIALLTGLIGVLMFKYFGILKKYSILILPYFIWLLIATSLNLYIYLYS